MNMSILKMVVVIIGVSVLACILGIVYLVLNDKSIPSTLETVTALGIGGLLGLLAPSQAAQNPNI
jgi:hypothetical protein